jgi:hypothetical protein
MKPRDSKAVATGRRNPQFVMIITQSKFFVGRCTKDTDELKGAVRVVRKVCIEEKVKLKDTLRKISSSSPGGPLPTANDATWVTCRRNMCKTAWVCWRQLLVGVSILL